jgi:diguanylate cyclase (GGDEF)-like protein
MSALKYGDSDLELVINKYDSVVALLDETATLFEMYVGSAKNLLSDPLNDKSLAYITEHSLELKNNIHLIVQQYQIEYEQAVKLQKTIDFFMISIAILVTLLGLLLSKVIKKHEYLAHYDFLTGLANRHSFYQFIKDKSPSDYHLFFIDLNKFKVVNDTYGHATGDEVLIEVSKRLEALFTHDFTFRYGGDEFICLLPAKQYDETKVNDYIISVKKNMLSPIFDSHNQEHLIGLSMGVSYNTIGFNKWDDLITFTDGLMYDSKTFSGHVITCRSNHDANKKLRLYNDIEYALEKKEIKPHFQKAYNPASQSVSIYYAVSRWHYQNNIIAATEFIPILRRKGLTCKFDRYIIQSIDDFYARKLKKSQADIMINISQNSIVSASSSGLIETLEALRMPKNKLILKFLEYTL